MLEEAELEDFDDACAVALPLTLPLTLPVFVSFAVADVELAVFTTPDEEPVADAELEAAVEAATSLSRLAVIVTPTHCAVPLTPPS